MAENTLDWLRRVGKAAAPATPAAAPVAEPVAAPPPRPAPAPAPAPVAVQPAPAPPIQAAPAPAAPPQLSLVTPAPAPAGARLATPAGGGYRAYGTDHVEGSFLEVRRVAAVPYTTASDALPLSYLLRVSFLAGPAGDTVTLIFSECAVILNGIHLGELHREVMAGKVSFVEEYDATRFPVRPAAGVPVILGVQMIEPGDAPPNPSSPRGGRKKGLAS